MADADPNAAGTAPAAAPAGAGPAAAAAGAAPPAWHAGFEQGFRDFWTAKKYDLSDATKTLEAVTRSYMGAEKLLGVPPEELIRVPKANADTSEINSYWNRIGVPKEAKDYDFSAVKHDNGEAVDQALSDALRTSLHSNRVSSAYAANIVKDVVRYLDSEVKGADAERTAHINEQNENLRKNWGNNWNSNMVAAQAGLERLAQATGLPIERARQAWDALSKVGGVDAAVAMEMLRVVGARTGEDTFVSGNRGGPAGDPAMMSRESARAEINALGQDKDFQQRLLNKNVEALRRWTALHQTMTGVVTTAA